MTAERTEDSAFGAVLRRNVDRILATLGRTHLDLYTAMGLAPSSYSLMFKNAGGPSGRTLERLARELGCTTEDLLKR